MSEAEATAPAPPPRAKGMNWVIWIFASVGILGVLAFVALVLMIGAFNYRREAPPAKLAAKSPEDKVSVLSTNLLSGTGKLEILLGVAGRDNPYASGLRGEDRRNLILLDKATGESRRLLADNRRAIVDIDYFAPVAESEQTTDDGSRDTVESETSADSSTQTSDAKKHKEVPVAYYALRVRSDPTHEDLLIGDIAVDHQAFVLKGLDGVDRMWMQSPGRLAVLMRLAGRLEFRVIDLPSLKIVAAKPVETDR